MGGPATSQGGVWIRIASSGRTDSPGQRTVSFASLAWRAVCLLADAPMLPGWDDAARGHWAQPRRDPRPLRDRAGSATPSEGPVRPRQLVLVVAHRHLPAVRLPHCPVRWQTHGRKTARPLTTLGGVEPDKPSERLGLSDREVTLGPRSKS